MRLFEITSSGWFLSFNEKQKVGSIVVRQGSSYPMGGFLEGHLERRRPEGQLPRTASFYFANHPSGEGSYVYNVEAVGQLNRHHTGWLRLLQGAPQTSIGELDHYAQGYWSGLAGC